MFELPKVLPWFQTSRMFPDRPDGGGPFTYFKKNTRSVRGLAAHETTWIPARTRGLDGLDSLQPPITLKQRPKGAKTTAGLVPDTSDRFQTVQTVQTVQPD